MPRQQAAAGAQRAHFRHAPGVQHRGAEIRVRLLDHHARHRGAARQHALQLQPALIGGVEVLLHPGEQVQPHGRHRAAEGDAFVADQFEQAGAVELHAGQHHLGAGARRGERNAPAVHMEQRRAQQQRLARRDRHRVGRHQRRNCAARPSGGSAARPWDCRWCPRCSTAPMRYSRRTPATRSRPSRLPADPRSTAGSAHRSTAAPHVRTARRSRARSAAEARAARPAAAKVTSKKT